jgi:hypothetical protein
MADFNTKLPRLPKGRYRDLEGDAYEILSPRPFGAEGTDRRRSWDALVAANGNHDRYLDLGGARKYLSRWVAAGWTRVRKEGPAAPIITDARLVALLRQMVLLAEEIATFLPPEVPDDDDAPGDKAFGPDADNYAAHPLTKRCNEDGALEPHVAKASRRGKHMGGPSREYVKGPKPNEAREGTYRKYMLDIILAHSTTHDAIAAYDKKPWPDHRPLDTNCFTWSAKQGYIRWV